jgi:SAM-dependent methyltransferase
MNTTSYNHRQRGKWHGVLQIIRFNWRFYAGGIVALALGGLILNFSSLDWLWKFAVILFLAITAFWMVMSLAVSHWVYDRSIITQWTWIGDCLPQPPRRWANIHAGLDESSPALKRLFPHTRGEILDVFDPLEMTEASIAEAREQVVNELDATRASLQKLPLADSEFDALFLIFAAHEIRRAEVRFKFFAELKRALKPGGRILMAEHLRDWKNFIAYGPGCFHFQSRATWHRAAAEAALEIEREFAITPFVRIFVLLKPAREYELKPAS